LGCVDECAHFGDHIPQPAVHKHPAAIVSAWPVGAVGHRDCIRIIRWEDELACVTPDGAANGVLSNEAAMRNNAPSKITAANAGGLRRLPMRMHRAARVAQFQRWCRYEMRMNARICFLLAVLAFSHPVPPAVAQGSLVVNGGLDTGVSGWTTNASSGYYEARKGNPGGCFTLYSSISQTVTGLVPGSQYVISGSYDIEGGNIVSSPSFGVAIDGIFLFEVAPHDYSWHDFAFSYRATSSAVVLSVAARLNGTSDVYRIDNLALQPTPSVALRVVGTSIFLSWATNTVGFSLQSATNLNTSNWVAVTNTPAIVGTNYSVTLSAAQQVRFFSLKR